LMSFLYPTIWIFTKLKYYTFAKLWLITLENVIVNNDITVIGFEIGPKSSVI